MALSSQLCIQAQRGLAVCSGSHSSQEMSRGESLTVWTLSLCILHCPQPPIFRHEPEACPQGPGGPNEVTPLVIWGILIKTLVSAGCEGHGRAEPPGHNELMKGLPYRS